MGGDSKRFAAALVLMLASGMAGLALQVVWTQQNALWLGHEAAAVLAVVAALFGGLGTGALLFSDRIERSAHPALWYAACEVVIAAWTLVLAFAMPSLSATLARAIDIDASPLQQWSVAFGGT